MNDRELLELAAKDAGHRTKADRLNVWLVEEDGSPIGQWNPLTDDGDALRLAVTLNLHVEWRFDGRVAVYPRDEVADIYCMESTREDKHAATRRAIVRSAAEIGKNRSD